MGYTRDSVRPVQNPLAKLPHQCLLELHDLSIESQIYLCDIDWLFEPVDLRSQGIN